MISEQFIKDFPNKKARVARFLAERSEATWKGAREARDATWSNEIQQALTFKLKIPLGSRPFFHEFWTIYKGIS